MTVICAEGRPSTTFHRAGATDHRSRRPRYRGDFDWPGIDMTNQLRTRC
ncbi:DUF2399 domain-containing protein [Streptomyces sp. NPDC048340]